MSSIEDLSAIFAQLCVDRLNHFEPDVDHVVEDQETSGCEEVESNYSGYELDVSLIQY